MQIDFSDADANEEVEPIDAGEMEVDGSSANENEIEVEPIDADEMEVEGSANEDEVVLINFGELTIEHLKIVKFCRILQVEVISYTR